MTSLLCNRINSGSRVAIRARVDAREKSSEVQLSGRVRSNLGVRVVRHKACPYRGHGGRLGGATWVGDRCYRQYAGDAAPTRHGVRGALRGEAPRTREGRRPDRTTAVVSDQWSVAEALAMLGDVTWLLVSLYQRCTRIDPQSELHPSVPNS